MAPSLADGNALFEFVVLKGNGVKGLVDSGLTKVPENYIQPPEERINKSTAASNQQLAIDFSELNGPNRDNVAAAIARAAETLGFFQIVNHGLPLELLEALKDAAHKFFGQPPENKAVYLKGKSPFVKYGTSFAPDKEKALEWKDYVSMIYTNDSDALEFWPNDCKEVALEYLRTSTHLVKSILEVLLEHLRVRLDESKLEALIGLQTINMNFYPICPDPDLTVGVGRHSDLGTLTLLLQDGIGGLSVKTEENLEGRDEEEWLEIPPIPGALVINIGDTLQVLSNGRYKSAEHRVRTTSTQSRVSVPHFTMPRPSEKIGPLPELVERDGTAHYREYMFGEYLANYFGNAHEGKKSLEFAETKSHF
ncbi:feruloyl CoA ortho-hydroxylase 1-like [Heracleum sosnowskyi]|uniref:feruloyl-CoA 6-hydroxylase n=1 Tax=Heracleum sosnowskyi TaxID=360622 RepID=A0AAD8IW16_9APIA|nr:feruloyl CoA ortho-hydroxylase 1-like [Heracleum sosnowskyi]